MKNALRLLAGLLAIGLAQPTLAATPFPTRPITIIVGYTPGGPTDTMCRVIVEAMSKELGQPIIVENRPGAGGAIGMVAVQRATPDGYTLAYGASSNVTLAPSVNSQVQYNPAQDFAAVGLVATTPFTLVASKSLPVKDLQEFIAYAKSKSGKLTMSTAGVGGAPHMAGLLFNRTIGVEANTIPYRGGAEQLMAVIKGDVDYTFDTVQTASKADVPNILAVTDAQRARTMPNVPTMSEAGLPNFAITIFHGIFAPKGTPPDVVAALYKAMTSALQSAEVRKRMEALGLSPGAMTSAQFSKFIADEFAKWSNFAKEAKLQIE